MANVYATKKKVLLVGKSAPPITGTSRWAEQLIASNRIGSEYEIELFSISVNTEVRSIGRPKASNLWPNVTLYFKYWRKLCRGSFLVVIVPLSQSPLGYLRDSVYTIIARSMGSAVLHYLHGSTFKRDVLQRSGSLFKLVRRLLRLGYGVVVLDEMFRSIFDEVYAASRIFVVYNGIADQKMDVPRLECSALYLSNISRPKGVLYAVKAVAELSEVGIKVRLRIAGEVADDALFNEINRIQRENNLEIDYLGVVEGVNKWQALSSSKLLVFTPIEDEGQPLVVIEALSCGLPIVATSKGCIGKMVENGKNGIIVNAASSQEIASAVKRLLADKCLYEKYSTRSRSIYLEKHTLEAMRSRLDKVLDVVCEHKTEHV